MTAACNPSDRQISAAAVNELRKRTGSHQPLMRAGTMPLPVVLIPLASNELVVRIHGVRRKGDVGFTPSEVVPHQVLQNRPEELLRAANDATSIGFSGRTLARRGDQILGVDGPII